MIEHFAPYAAGYLGALAVRVAVRRAIVKRRARRRADLMVSPRTLDVLRRRQGVGRG